MNNQLFKTSTSKNWFFGRLILIALFALALFLRLNDISRESFSIDESSSLYYAGSEGWRSLFWDNNPPLYHVILKIWLYLAPMNEFWTRALSAFISACGVIAIYIVGVATGSKLRGLWLACLLCFSGISIMYAQETRMYALLELAAICFFCATLRLSEVGRLRNWLWFGVSGVILVSTHLAGFVAGYLGLVYLAVNGKINQRRAFITFSVLAALSLFTVAYSFHSKALLWQHMIRHSNELPLLLYEFGQGRWVMVVGTIAVTVLALFHEEQRLRQFARVSFVFILLLLSAGFVVSQVGERDVFIARYYIFLNPVYLLLIILGLEKLTQLLKPHAQRVAPLIAPTFVFCFCAFYSWGYHYITPAWRELAKFVVEKKAPLVLTTRSKGLQMPYYFLAHVPVEQVNYSERFIDLLQTRLAEKGSVWIVDNYWSRTTYIRYLLAQLTLMNIPYEIFQFERDGAESVYAIRVWKP